MGFHNRAMSRHDNMLFSCFLLFPV
ncbi:unnamed protein product [Spirodela intermedia]|uniref:Uncharacterized protein n=1 Tax=Spirodela intermedia TaxID=51605 RepID=A0A7I8JSR1_SPIIN|nr:unnamed protein product [Spirodela intermedia]CAA6673216.1 unnamed protein product [Spirodela intermedia]